MRKHHILLIGAAILLASCASVSNTTVKKTSAVLEISASIQQMPTVVELQVNPKTVRMDSTWTTSIWDIENKKEAISYMTAELLSKHQADVLVLPKVNYEKQIRKNTVTYNLQVEGYPARYTNFHTATKLDMQVLRGDADTVYCPIVINVEGNQGKVSPRQEREAIEQVSEQLLDTKSKKKKKSSAQPLPIIDPKKQ